MSKVLVTGGSGFIGSHCIVQLLEAGYEVRTTVRNLQVVRVDADNHLVLVRGAVPGPNGGLVLVRPTNKRD